MAKQKVVKSDLVLKEALAVKRIMRHRDLGKAAATKYMNDRLGKGKSAGGFILAGGKPNSTQSSKLKAHTALHTPNKPKPNADKTPKSGNGGRLRPGPNAAGPASARTTSARDQALVDRALNPGPTATVRTTRPGYSLAGGPPPTPAGPTAGYRTTPSRTTAAVTTPATTAPPRNSLAVAPPMRNRPTGGGPRKATGGDAGVFGGYIPSSVKSAPSSKATGTVSNGSRSNLPRRKSGGPSKKPAAYARNGGGTSGRVRTA